MLRYFPFKALKRSGGSYGVVKSIKCPIARNFSFIEKSSKNAYFPPGESKPFSISRAHSTRKNLPPFCGDEPLKFQIKKPPRSFSNKRQTDFSSASLSSSAKLGAQGDPKVDSAAKSRDPLEENNAGAAAGTGKPAPSGRPSWMFNAAMTILLLVSIGEYWTGVDEAQIKQMLDRVCELPLKVRRARMVDSQDLKGNEERRSMFIVLSALSKHREPDKHLLR